MKHLKLLLIVLLCSVTMSYGQIYSEDFSGQNGKGAIGPTPTIDVTGVTWNIDVSGSALTAATDYFRVDTEVFQARDVGGPSIWFSPSIDISTHTNVFFNLDVTEAGNKEMTDTFDTEYRINGGAWTTAATNGNLIDDFLNTTVSQTGLSGNTLEIRITINNNADGELHRFDNIIVDGTLTTTTVEFVSTTSSVTEDGASIDVCVEIANQDATTATTVEIALNGTSTATNGTDYDDNAASPISFPQTITFPAGSATNQCFTIYIDDDAVFEGNETIVLDLQNASGGNSATIGTNAQHTLTITDNDPDPCNSIFSDDFSTGLAQWNNTADWTTVAGELKHDLSGIVGDSYINADIGIQNLEFADYEWSFCMRNGNWDPSINNNFSFVLLSNNSDLSSNITGYKVGINQASESDDLLKIYSLNNGTNSQIAGLASTFDWDANDDVCVRVTRSSNGDWELFYNDGSGEISGATANDTTFTTGSFIGANFEYSSTRAGLLWIDDVNVCSNPITCDTMVTWDGTSWSSLPNASTSAVLNANYNTSIAGQPSFTACSLTVSSGFNLTIAPNDYVEVLTDVTNNGRIFIQDKGSFVQVDNAATYDDTGSSFFATDNTAQVTRSTATINNWYEYTYWSSPVSNETVEDVLFTANPDRRFTFNAANFADLTYETNNNNGTTAYIAGDVLDDIDDNGDDWQFASGLMLQGVGYAATMSPTSISFGGPNFDHIFEGTLNNGDIDVAVVRNDDSNSTSAVPDNNWNFIGNPYPSAIDVDLFFAVNNWSTSNTNATLDGSIYLWSQNSPPSNTNNGNQVLNFSGDYAVINGMGETAGGDMITPTREISSAQGFFVNLVDTDDRVSSIGNVTFNNAMRVRDNNSQFFRTSENTTLSSAIETFRINLTSDNGIFSQLLVGYSAAATNGFDGAYFDAAKNSSANTPVIFGSSIDNNAYAYAIQGKNINSLNENEVVSLAFSTSISVPTIYNISLISIEGDFLSNNAIFLKDNLNNTYQNLSASDYSFTSQTGEFDNRFEIVFTNTLSTEDFDSSAQNLSIIELQDDNVKFTLASKDLTIKNVEILDLLGRSVYQFRGSEKTEVYNLSNLSSSVYIAKIELSNGSVISKKAIKK